MKNHIIIILVTCLVVTSYMWYDTHSTLRETRELAEIASIMLEHSQLKERRSYLHGGPFAESLDGAIDSLRNEYERRLHEYRVKYDGARYYDISFYGGMVVLGDELPEFRDTLDHYRRVYADSSHGVWIDVGDSVRNGSVRHVVLHRTIIDTLDGSAHTYITAPPSRQGSAP